MPGCRLPSMASRLENRTVGRRKVPAYVLFLSLCAATGGLMFGYDVGISGGVTVMDKFLCRFFPHVLEKKLNSQQCPGQTNTCNHISNNQSSQHLSHCKSVSNQALQENDTKVSEGMNHVKQYYCLFNHQNVQLFTSSLYLAAMVATIFAAYVSKQKGRKMTIIISSVFYSLGVIINIASGSIHLRNHVAFIMLIVGRIFLGIGVGFGNQAIPLFISEIAPPDARGSLNYLFQLNITIGIFLANLVNWFSKSRWGLSFGLAGVPCLIFVIGSFFLIETPSSFVKRGFNEQAREVLHSIRGHDINIELVIQDIVRACKETPYDVLRERETINESPKGGAASLKSSKKLFNGLFARSNVPPLLITIFVQLFQQFTGINTMMLYAPILFTSFGSKTKILLIFVLIIGVINLASTILSILLVDRVGRRRLLLVASSVMLFAQLLLGVMLIGTNEKESLEHWRAIVMVILVCIFVGAFECSWGPLGWLISTEIFPFMCRSEGQSVAVFSNMLFTFVIAHTSLYMLCTLTYGIFFFFAACILIMGICSFLFLPETMNMDIETVNYIWSCNRFWRHFASSPPSFCFNALVSPFHNLPQHSFPHHEMANTNTNIHSSPN